MISRFQVPRSGTSWSGDLVPCQECRRWPWRGPKCDDWVVPDVAMCRVMWWPMKWGDVWLWIQMKCIVIICHCYSLCIVHKHSSKDFPVDTFSLSTPQPHNLHSRIAIFWKLFHHFRVATIYTHPLSTDCPMGLEIRSTLSTFEQQYSRSRPFGVKDCDKAFARPSSPVAWCECVFVQKPEWKLREQVGYRSRWVLCASRFDGYLGMYMDNVWKIWWYNYSLSIVRLFTIWSKLKLVSISSFRQIPRMFKVSSADAQRRGADPILGMLAAEKGSNSSKSQPSNTCTTCSIVGHPRSAMTEKKSKYVLRWNVFWWENAAVEWLYLENADICDIILTIVFIFSIDMSWHVTMLQQRPPLGLEGCVEDWHRPSEGLTFVSVVPMSTMWGAAQ